MSNTILDKLIPIDNSLAGPCSCLGKMYDEEYCACILKIKNIPRSKPAEEALCLAKLQLEKLSML